MSTPSTRTSTSTPTSSSASPPAESGPPLPRLLGPGGRIAVIAAMAVGSVAMWLGVPFGLVYVVSKLVDTQRPTLGPYLVILFGVPVGMTLIGKGLGALDRYYGRRTGTLQERRQAVWLRSMRGERRQAGGWRVLDVVMLWSVTTAVVCFGVWFFFFAGPSI